MNASAFDAVIAGAGLSGLSLAAQLATNGWHNRSVLVVDDAAATPSATLWASWCDGPGLLDAAVSRRYRQVQIHAAGTSRVVPLGRYHYQVVRRSDLRHVVMGLVRTCPRFVLADGHVEDIRDGGGAAEVVIDRQTIRAAWVFDSVRAGPSSVDVDARLAFTGYDIRCGHPVFDADTPVLFDFRTPQTGAARFVYVLPQDSHHALVEVTQFVPRHTVVPTEAARRDALDAYLGAALHCQTYEILRTESAVLPLRAHPGRRGNGRVLAIGARGGLVKASTGYGYLRIQRDCEAIAISLARHGHPFDLPRPRLRHQLLDAVLLDVLDRDPAQLELAFSRLFSANPAERVLRFLDEGTGVADELRLIRSFPPLPYLRAFATRAVHRQR
jgi:lycopene beta-cyclase